MNQPNIPTINLVASTWLFTCLVFFITFGLFTKGAGNWFFSGIAAFFGALPILLFCLLGANILKKIRTKNKLILIVLGTSLGLVFGFIGFYFANTVIGNFQVLQPAFPISGAFAGLLLSFKISR